VVYYGDTAITSFSLGTLNQYVHTTSKAGADSVYKTTVAGSNYAFHIDQLNHEIYNVDSLPYGTDVAHVICSLGTKNSGIPVWKSVSSDTLTTHSNTDSIDFSSARELRVYAADGSGYRSYQVKVNVRQKEENVTSWSYLGGQPKLAAIHDMHAVTADGRLFVSGTVDGAAVCYATSLTDGKTWEPATFPSGADSNVNGAVVSSPWWPTQDVNLVRLPKKTNADTYQLVLVGNRSVADYPHDLTAMVWSRVEEMTADSESQPWIFQPFESNNKYALPRMEHLQVVAWNDRVVALGGKGLGGCTQQAFLQLYVSLDGGITWKDDSSLQLPYGFAADSSSFALAADTNGCLWMICGESGQVWRGQ
jgi:hypothetical protein